MTRLDYNEGCDRSIQLNHSCNTSQSMQELGLHSTQKDEGLTMSKSNLTKKLESAKIFARNNISELVRDYRALQASGNRPDGTAYDKLIALCNGFDTNVMGIANSILIDAAMQYITDMENESKEVSGELCVGCLARYVGDDDNLYKDQLCYIHELSGNGACASILLPPYYGSAWYDLSDFRLVRQTTDAEYLYFMQVNTVGDIEDKGPHYKKEFKLLKTMEANIGQDLRDELKAREAKRNTTKKVK